MRGLPQSPSPLRCWPAFRPPAARPRSSRWWQYDPNKRQRAGAMAKSWNRTETWVALIVLGIGSAILAIGGLWVYVSATATPLHPEPDRVPSVTLSDPSRQWSGAVERGRQEARASLIEQNLPGLSVAVGVAGEIVWAEGFGWADLEKRVKVEPQTRFRIGTASIPLTSAAAGLLMEKNRLKLDDEIQAYVPDFPKKQ